jgi:hypothetical protein
MGGIVSGLFGGGQQEAQKPPTFSKSTTKLVGKPLSAVYGRATVKGNIVYRGVDPTGQTMGEVVALCWGPVTIPPESVRVNDKRPQRVNGKIPPSRNLPPTWENGVFVNTGSGKLGQPIAFGTGPVGYNRCAYLEINGFASSTVTSFDNVQCDVVRPALFKPTGPSTDYNTPIPAAIAAAFPSGIRSDNPIAAALDYILNIDYGPGKDPSYFGDFATWIDAINYCDEIVGFQTGGVTWGLTRNFAIGADNLTLTKVGTTDIWIDGTTQWNAGAQSREAVVSGNFSVSAIAQPFSAPGGNTNNVMFGMESRGLNVDSPGTFTKIDYAIHLNGSGQAEVWENGFFITNLVSYRAGDTLTIDCTSGTVRYKKNGTTYHTSGSTPSAYPYQVRAAAARNNAAIFITSFSGGLQAPRYSIGLEVGTDQNQSHMDIIQAIMQTAFAAPFESNGILKCFIAKAKDPVAHLDRSNFEPSGATTTDILQVPNIIELTYTNEVIAGEYGGDPLTAIWKDDDSIGTWGEIRSDVQIIGIPSGFQADRMAGYMGRRAQQERKRLTGTADGKFFNLEPGDVIGVTVGDATTNWFTDKLFWVDSIEPDDNTGTVKLELLEYAELFDDAVAIPMNNLPPQPPANGPVGLVDINPVYFDAPSLLDPAGPAIWLGASSPGRPVAPGRGARGIVSFWYQNPGILGDAPWADAYHEIFTLVGGHKGQENFLQATAWYGSSFSKFGFDLNGWTGSPDGAAPDLGSGRPLGAYLDQNDITTTTSYNVCFQWDFTGQIPTLTTRFNGGTAHTWEGDAIPHGFRGNWLTGFETVQQQARIRIGSDGNENKGDWLLANLWIGVDDDLVLFDGTLLDITDDSHCARFGSSSVPDLGNSGEGVTGKPPLYFFQGGSTVASTGRAFGPFADDTGGSISSTSTASFGGSTDGYRFTKDGYAEANNLNIGGGSFNQSLPLGGYTGSYNGCYVWVSYDDGTTYTNLGQLTPMVTGHFINGIPAGGSDPDTDETSYAILTRTQSTDGLPNPDPSDADATSDGAIAIMLRTQPQRYGNGIAFSQFQVSGQGGQGDGQPEIAGFAAVTAYTGGSFTVGYLRRGQYGTVNCAHGQAGWEGYKSATFGVLSSQSILRIPYEAGDIGEVIYVKLQAIEPDGTVAIELDDISGFPIPLAGPDNNRAPPSVISVTDTTPAGPTHTMQFSVVYDNTADGTWGSFSGLELAYEQYGNRTPVGFTPDVGSDLTGTSSTFVAAPGNLVCLARAIYSTGASPWTVCEYFVRDIA